MTEDMAEYLSMLHMKTKASPLLHGRKIMVGNKHPGVMMHT